MWGGGGEIATGGGGGKGKSFLFDIFVSAPLILLLFAIEFAGRGDGGSLSQQQKNNNTTPPPFPNGKYFFAVRPAIDVSSLLLPRSRRQHPELPNCEKAAIFARCSPQINPPEEEEKEKVR